MLSLIALLAVAAPPTISAPPVPVASGNVTVSIPIAYTLDRPETTAAGVYDLQGRLFRVLWNHQRQDAGARTIFWDGRDDFGVPAPPGRYRVRIVQNRAVYRNVGAIGNSGLPPNGFGHTPAGMMSVAIGPDGAIYTANGWDEAGSDFKKWDPQGHSVYGANFEIRNGDPNGMPYAITTDDHYLYCSVGGWARAPWNERQQVQRFLLADGKPAPFSDPGTVSGHINIYEWPSRMLPPGLSSERKDLLSLPLRSLAVKHGVLYVADALGNRVLMYDAATGAPRGSFPVTLPEAIAVDNAGQIWVGHDDHRLAVFQAEGKAGREVLQDLNRVVSLSFSASGELFVADAGVGQALIYGVSGRTAELKLLRRFGRAAHPGDRSADAFFKLAGAAVDPQGNLVTIQDEPISGARVARWSPAGESYRLEWEQFGSEFVSLGNYGPTRPDRFYTMSFHRDRLLNFSEGKWDYTADVAPSGENYHSDTHGVPRVLSLRGHSLFFCPTGDGVQVYRIGHEGLELSALVGGASPQPNGAHQGPLGQWSWHAGAALPGVALPGVASFQKGVSGQTGNSGAVTPVRPGDVEWFRRPGQGHYSCFGMDVDTSGNIWFANTTTHSIWTIPLSGLDGGGNPIYHWAQAHEVIPRDFSSFAFEPNMAQRAPDGSIYAFGWSHTWPAPANNPFWMGGSTLVRFDSAGRRLWAVPLPAACVGLDFIPGGGCMVGEGRGAHILHVSDGGLIIGELEPGAAMGQESGWLDNHASVAVERNPADHCLDVFTEDDLDDRIGWYRVDDHNLPIIERSVRIDLPPQ